MKVKVIEVNSEGIIFENNIKIYSDHDQDCCEHHWLDFTHLSVSDFDDNLFDLSDDSFFRRIPEYGIELIPVSGFSVKIPGYGSNNGYYSDNLTLVVSGDDFNREYDITECQEDDY